MNRSEDLKEYRKKIAEEIRFKAGTFVAKHVNKRMSIPLSRLLARTRVTPNQITVFAFFWSLVGFFFLFFPRTFLWAFACFQINSILDGTDGEVARMNFSFSAFGKKLDVYADYLTSVLLITGTFAGYARMNPQPETVAGSLLGTVLLALVGVVWGVAVKKGLTPENFDDVEGLCHKRLRHPKTAAEISLAFFLFVSRRDFYIFAAFLLTLTGWRAVIPWFLGFVCFSWLVLSWDTLKALRHHSKRHPA